MNAVQNKLMLLIDANLPPKRFKNDALVEIMCIELTNRKMRDYEIVELCFDKIEAQPNSNIIFILLTRDDKFFEYCFGHKLLIKDSENIEFYPKHSAIVKDTGERLLPIYIIALENAGTMRRAKLAKLMTQAVNSFIQNFR